MVTVFDVFKWIPNPIGRTTEKFLHFNLFSQRNLIFLLIVPWSSYEINLSLLVVSQETIRRNRLAWATADNKKLNVLFYVALPDPQLNTWSSKYQKKSKLGVKEKINKRTIGPQHTPSRWFFVYDPYKLPGCFKNIFFCFTLNLTFFGIQRIILVVPTWSDQGRKDKKGECGNIP